MYLFFFGSAAMPFISLACPLAQIPVERKVRFTRTGKYVRLHPSSLRVTYKYMYNFMCECDYVFILRSASKYWSEFTLPFALTTHKYQLEEAFYVWTTHYGEPVTSLKFNCCLCCLSTRELETNTTEIEWWCHIQKRVLCWYDHCFGFGYPVHLVTCFILALLHSAIMYSYAFYGRCLYGSSRLKVRGPIEVSHNNGDYSRPAVKAEGGEVIGRLQHTSIFYFPYSSNRDRLPSEADRS